MTLRVHTARASYGGDDRLDITRKSNDEFGKTFAPSWQLLRPFLALREAGKLTDEVWLDYVERYTAEMRFSYRARRNDWDRLLALDHVVLCCFCSEPTRCHRRVLAEILTKLGAIDCGELGEWSWWIDLPYATFGLVVRDGIVVEAAPIAQWTVGKREAQAVEHYRKKGATTVCILPQTYSTTPAGTQPLSTKSS